MVCVTKIHHDHDNCEHKGNESKKNLQVFYNEQYDSYSGYCFSCGTHVKDVYEKGEKPDIKVKTKEEIFQEVQEIRELPAYNQKYRGIPASYYGKWGVRLGLSEMDGKTPFAIYYGYTKGTKLLGWKVRMLAKKAFWSVGETKGADPFGWIQARKVGGKRVYVVEGEQDAIALDYMMIAYHAKTKFKDRRYAIISLPGGVDTMGRTMKLASKYFDEVVLVVDNDEAGQKSIKKAQKLNPDVLMVDMPLGCKDANDAVQKGPESMNALVNSCLWSAHKPPIKGVIQVSDIIEKAQQKVEMGLSYPFDTLTEMAYGQRFGECMALGAGVGLGKTLIAHEIAAHNIMVHDTPTFMVLLEEQNVNSLRNVAGKIDSIPYHKPDAEYDMEKFRETANQLQNKLLLWEDDGDQYLRFDLDEIIKAIRFNVAEYGVKFVTIDNMTRLVDHLNTSEANEFINKYASELEALSVQLDIHIDVYSHLNKPYKGTSHEMGGGVEASQFTGSRGLMRSFPMMAGFERNKHAEGILASRSYISIVKNRKFGNEGKIKTQYDPRTGRLQENCWDGDTIIVKEE